MMIKGWLITIVAIYVLFQTAAICAAQSAANQSTKSEDYQPSIRLDKHLVKGGAELLVVTSQMKSVPDEQTDVPLIALLRDTLGDDDSNNDRLRYIWDFSFVRPTRRQKIFSSIPFFYMHVGGRKLAPNNPPQPLLDIAGERNRLCRRWFWNVISRVGLESQGMFFGPSMRAQERNDREYRKKHLNHALDVLSLLGEKSIDTGGIANADNESIDAELSSEEQETLQARMVLAGKAMGEFVNEYRFKKTYQKQLRQVEEWRGRNWELLRQRAETEGLYFEPLALPGRSATHALLWVSKSDVKMTQNESTPRRFRKRFLSITNPWRDDRLSNWSGYTEMRWFDKNNYSVSSETPEAHPVEMIPLALYGLEHPRIPVLLVDFRRGLNPGLREVSGRALNDFANGLFSLTRPGNLYYIAGRGLLNFVLHRRGTDINQPSRLQSLAKLKLLVLLDETIDPTLKNDVYQQLQRVTLNPLTNNWLEEQQMARSQYAALIDYVRSSEGLPAQLVKDRRSEMVQHKHGRAALLGFHALRLFSFGLYNHIESYNSETLAELGIERKLNNHRRFITELSKTGSLIDVGWDLEKVRNSLSFLAEHGTSKDMTLLKAVRRIYSLTEDEETRKLASSLLSLLSQK